MNILNVNPLILICGGVVLVTLFVGFLYWKDKRHPKQVDARIESDKSEELGEKTQGKYRAYLWDNENRLYPIRIPDKIGGLWAADTTMPSPGMCYLVKEILAKNGDPIPDKYEKYDPRENPIVEADSPFRAYDASHCNHLVNAVYMSPLSIWDKINMFLPYAAAFCIFIVILTVLDKI